MWNTVDIVSQDFRGLTFCYVNVLQPPSLHLHAILCTNALRRVWPFGEIQTVKVVCFLPPGPRKQDPLDP